MYRFQTPLRSLYILLHPQAFDLENERIHEPLNIKRYGVENAGAWTFWSCIVIHITPLIMLYFLGIMSITFVAILSINYCLLGYFGGACALGYTKHNLPSSKEEKSHDMRMLISYSTLLMLTGAWPMIYLKIIIPAGFVGMFVLPLYLLVGLATILHFFYTAPKVDNIQNLGIRDHIYGFIADRLLPKSFSLLEMAKIRISNEKISAGNSEESPINSNALPEATPVVNSELSVHGHQPEAPQTNELF